MPFPQIVVGAACGSWWSGDFDADGIPMSSQRDGAPRGYLVFEFDGNTFRHTFKATGQPSERQMSVSVLSPAFSTWFETLNAWVAGNPAKDQTPPVNIHDLPDTRFVPLTEVANTSIVANVWNGSRQHEVTLQIGDRATVIMQRTQAGAGEGMLTSLDPFALAKQMQVARYAFGSVPGDVNAQGFELFTRSKYGPANSRPLDSWMWTQTSMHIWTAKLPAGLEPGSHVAKVTAVHKYGRSFTETLTFEVGEERPNPCFVRERFTR